MAVVRRWQHWGILNCIYLGETGFNPISPPQGPDRHTNIEIRHYTYINGGTNITKSDVAGLDGCGNNIV